jgi:ectoine hydroxylase-related dioxygenase (phytanoyl-CoA dioxygenase family)
MDRESFDSLGFCTIPGAVPAETLDELARSVEGLLSAKAAPGARNLDGLAPPVARFAESRKIADLLDSLGAPGAFLVRGIFFDKHPGANWHVPWHQDLTIAVREKKEIAGFGPWSGKGGVPHVRPPPSVLAGMVTLRVHLDDCDPDNGALRVLPGSHRHGVLSAALIQRWRSEHREVPCAVPRGGILAMRPLLLHASSRAMRPRRRRVIHLEFATDALPGGLEWKQPEGMAG